MLKMQMKENINVLLENLKKLVLITIKMEKLSWNILMIWMISILMSTIEEKNKVLIVCDDMIADMIINKKLDPC